MNSEILKKITDSIQEKIGEDTASIISDDLGTLITENEKTLEEIKNKDDEITSLKDKNQKLISANANLFQQVGFKKEEKEEEKENKEEKPKKFDFRSAFDEFGNFKK